MLTCRVESSSFLHVTLGGLEPADANRAAIATIAGLPAEAAPVVIEAYGATSLHRQLELPKSSSWTELTQARDAYRDVRAVRKTDRRCRRHGRESRAGRLETKKIAEEALMIIDIAALIRKYSDEWLPSVCSGLTGY